MEIQRLKQPVSSNRNIRLNSRTVIVDCVYYACKIINVCACICMYVPIYKKYNGQKEWSLPSTETQGVRQNEFAQPQYFSDA